VSVLRSLRRALGQSRLIALAVLVVIVFFAAGFVELAVARRGMEVRHQQALERVEQMRRQNTLLQLQLERAQRDELTPWLAWEMFGKLPKGAGGIQTEPPLPAEVVGPEQPETPAWRNWLKAIGLN
jgi:hypothetical protein